MSGKSGLARIDRLPSARAPTSMRPWSQPTILPSARARATSSSVARERWYASFDSRMAASTASSENDGPQYAWRNRSKALTPACRAIRYAAPSAMPLSDDAGCTKVSRTSSISESLPFMQQFIATPPARHSDRAPVIPISVLTNPPTTCSSRHCTLKARSRWPDSIGWCPSRGRPNTSTNRSVKRRPQARSPR